MHKTLQSEEVSILVAEFFFVGGVLCGSFCKAFPFQRADRMFFCLVNDRLLLLCPKHDLCDQPKSLVLPVANNKLRL